MSRTNLNLNSFRNFIRRPLRRQNRTHFNTRAINSLGGTTRNILRPHRQRTRLVSFRCQQAPDNQGTRVGTTSHVNFLRRYTRKFSRGPQNRPTRQRARRRHHRNRRHALPTGTVNISRRLVLKRRRHRLRPLQASLLGITTNSSPLPTVSIRTFSTQQINRRHTRIKTRINSFARVNNIIISSRFTTIQMNSHVTLNVRRRGLNTQYSRIFNRNYQRLNRNRINTRRHTLAATPNRNNTSIIHKGRCMKFNNSLLQLNTNTNGPNANTQIMNFAKGLLTTSRIRHLVMGGGLQSSLDTPTLSTPSLVDHNNQNLRRNLRFNVTRQPRRRGVPVNMARIRQNRIKIIFRHLTRQFRRHRTLLGYQHLNHQRIHRRARRVLSQFMN